MLTDGANTYGYNAESEIKFGQSMGKAVREIIAVPC